MQSFFNTRKSVLVQMMLRLAPKLCIDKTVHVHVYLQ